MFLFGLRWCGECPAAISIWSTSTASTLCLLLQGAFVVHPQSSSQRARFFTYVSRLLLYFYREIHECIRVASFRNAEQKPGRQLPRAHRRQRIPGRSGKDQKNWKTIIMGKKTNVSTMLVQWVSKNKSFPSCTTRCWIFPLLFTLLLFILIDFWCA